MILVRLLSSLDKWKVWLVALASCIVVCAKADSLSFFHCFVIINYTVRRVEQPTCHRTLNFLSRIGYCTKEYWAFLFNDIVEYLRGTRVGVFKGVRCLCNKQKSWLLVRALSIYPAIKGMLLKAPSMRWDPPVLLLLQVLLAGWWFLLFADAVFAYCVVSTTSSLGKRQEIAGLYAAWGRFVRRRYEELWLRAGDANTRARVCNSRSAISMLVQAPDLVMPL